MRLAALAAAAILVATPALAVDFKTPLLDPDGAGLYDELGQGAVTPGKHCGDPGEKPCLTLGIAAYRALTYTHPDEASLPGDQKFARGMLALRLRDAGDEQISAEDTALAKKMIAKLYGPLVVVRAWRLLDPGAK